MLARALGGLRLVVATDSGVQILVSMLARALGGLRLTQEMTRMTVDQGFNARQSVRGSATKDFRWAKYFSFCFNARQSVRGSATFAGNSWDYIYFSFNARQSVRGSATQVITTLKVLVNVFQCSPER